VKQSWQAVVRAPPKAVFQFLWDVQLIEEYTKLKVTTSDDEVGAGFSWTERRLLRKRTWTMTAFDRRGLCFTATSGDLSVTWAAKKGGTGSTNLRMTAEGAKAAIARFAKTDGKRMARLAGCLETEAPKQGAQTEAHSRA
jgi:hypothetical protein